MKVSPAARLAKERAIFRAPVENLGKPAAVLDKIVEGKVEKFFAESCLLEQAYLRDPERTVREVVTQAIA